jgi:predicted ribosomally synthesized peptide with nif11-like leader
MAGPGDTDGSDPRGTGVALRFIAAIRTDPQLRERLAALAPAAGLEPVVALARDAGFNLSVEDLRRGFVADWGLRRARYLRQAPPDNAASAVAVVQSPESGR